MIVTARIDSPPRGRKATHAINQEALDKVTAAHVGHAKPANIQTATVEPATTVNEAPECVLTHDAGAQWMARAVGISGNAVGKVPPHLEERIAWMHDVYKVAWRDRALLASVEVPGSPFTANDVLEFGYAITFLSDASLDRDGLGSNDAKIGPATLTDDELYLQMQAKRVAVCDGLMIVFVNEAGKRPEVRAIRSKRSRRVQTRTNEKLFNLCTATVTASLHRLPNHPDAALDELRLLDAEWRRRGRLFANAPIDIVARANHLAKTCLHKITLRARYLVKVGLKSQAEYPGFKVPAARSRRAAKTPVTAPTTTPAATPVHT